MYLNYNGFCTASGIFERLTSTLDVFKCIWKPRIEEKIQWLTSTLDVFKFKYINSLIVYINMINFDIRCI